MLIVLENPTNARFVIISEFSPPRHSVRPSISLLSRPLRFRPCPCPCPCPFPTPHLQPIQKPLRQSPLPPLPHHPPPFLNLLPPPLPFLPPLPHPPLRLRPLPRQRLHLPSPRLLIPTKRIEPHPLRPHFLRRIVVHLLRRRRAAVALARDGRHPRRDRLVRVEGPALHRVAVDERAGRRRARRHVEELFLRVRYCCAAPCFAGGFAARAAAQAAELVFVLDYRGVVAVVLAGAFVVGARGSAVVGRCASLLLLSPLAVEVHEWGPLVVDARGRGRGRGGHVVATLHGRVEAGLLLHLALRAVQDGGVDGAEIGVVGLLRGGSAGEVGEGALVGVAVVGGEDVVFAGFGGPRPRGGAGGGFGRLGDQRGEVRGEGEGSGGGDFVLGGAGRAGGAVEGGGVGGHSEGGQWRSVRG